MSRRSVLSTWQAGRYCQVSPYTIRHWINTGRLPAYTTPGGHRRIRLQDLDTFLLAHHMPLPVDFQSGRTRVLVLAEERLLRELREIERWSEDLQVTLTASAFEGGLLITSFDPHLLLVDLDAPTWDGLSICRRLREGPDTSHVRLAGVTKSASVEVLEEAESSGVQHCFTAPLDRRDLFRFLRHEFPNCRWNRGGLR
jgi:excisionase family DNA binding protein